jgi:hypothetical protein
LEEEDVSEINEARERAIRALFDQARKSYPKCDHLSLLRLVSPKRPMGTDVREMLRIAEEFKQ